jgi:hypothetical protein
MMASQHVSEMTLDELKAWVDAQVDRRMQERMHPLDSRSIREINDSIRRNRWTPPKDAPSNLELLRQDRDR